MLGRSVRFLKPDRSLRAITGAATAVAGPNGTDGLDLLIAALDNRNIRRILSSLGLDPKAVARRANTDHSRGEGPGLTPDAKLVVEALSRRALQRRRDSSPADLLVSLVETPGPARTLLLGMGLDEGRLEALDA